MRHPLRPNHPFETLLTSDAVAGASMNPEDPAEVIITLEDPTRIWQLSNTVSGFIGIVLDSRVLAAPLMETVIHPLRVKPSHYEDQGRMLAVMLRSGPLPFVLRPICMTYIQDSPGAPTVTLPAPPSPTVSPPSPTMSPPTMTPSITMTLPAAPSPSVTP